MTISLSSWMIVSTMVQLGLSWWQAWICVWLGYSLVTPFIVLNARPGAIFHVTFPVVARTSFGLYGSLWPVFNRGVMAWSVILNAFWVLAHRFFPVSGMECRRVNLNESSLQSLIQSVGEHRWNMYSDRWVELDIRTIDSSIARSP